MFLMVHAFLPLTILLASWEKVYLIHNVYLKFRKIMILIHYLSYTTYSRILSTMNVVIFYRISWQVIITWKNFQISFLQNLYPVKTLDLSTKYFVVFWEFFEVNCIFNFFRIMWHWQFVSESWSKITVISRITSSFYF